MQAHRPVSGRIPHVMGGIVSPYLVPFDVLMGVSSPMGGVVLGGVVGFAASRLSSGNSSAVVNL